MCDTVHGKWPSCCTGTQGLGLGVPNALPGSGWAAAPQSACSASGCRLRFFKLSELIEVQGETRKLTKAARGSQGRGAGGRNLHSQPRHCPSTGTQNSGCSGAL